MIGRISSLQHPLVKRLVKLRKSRKYRFDCKKLVLSGVKLVCEVCCDFEAETLFVMEGTVPPPEVKAKKILKATPNVMKKISGLKSPENILAEVPMPLESSLEEGRYIVVLDGLSDPGNLGTLLRTALAFSWDGAFIISNSVDAFNDKALSAARGAIFRLPFRLGKWEDVLSFVKEKNFSPFLADMEGESVENVSFSKEEKVLLILGNESHGASIQAKEFCRKITIPISRNMESLNVAIAGGIIMCLWKHSLHAERLC